MIASDITGDANHAGVEYWLGFSVREDASAAATLNFRKAAVGGDILFTLTLAADESAAVFFPKGMNSEGGVYVEEVAGSVTGQLYSPG